MTTPLAGAFRSTPIEEKQSIPDITPMRRGRPAKAEGNSRTPKPSRSPLRGAANDPWAALDSVTPSVGVLDDASARFPALDDFSLLHDSGSKFAFDPNRDTQKQSSRDITQRVTDALADDAFAQPTVTSKPTQRQPSSNPQRVESQSTQPVHNAPTTGLATKTAIQQSASQRPSMVSTGTMTSPSPPSPTLQNTANRPIFSFPPSSSDHRSSSQPRASDSSEVAVVPLQAGALGNKRPDFLQHRSRSQILTTDPSPSSQPHLEMNHRLSYSNGVDSTVQRSKSANSRARPASAQNPSKPSLLRRMSREKAKNELQGSEAMNHILISVPIGDADDGEEMIKIDSNVDFLKAMEEEEASKRKEKRLSSGSRHIKRASMPSVSLSGTKNLLAGRFGDAFKRFETNAGGAQSRDASRSPERRTSGLTPIAGSEATDSRSDDGHELEESEEIPPELRRELERQRLSQEEKRVADGAAAYRLRLAQGGDSRRGRPGGGPRNNKAASIQTKVQTLLDESGRASPSPTKTAFGYGRFTDAPEQMSAGQPPQNHPPRTTSRQPPPSSDEQPPKSKPSLNIAPNSAPTSSRLGPSLPVQPSLTNTAPRHSAPPSERPFPRASAPPKPQTKPQNLRTGDRPPQSPAKSAPMIAKKPLPPRLQEQQEPFQNKPTMDGADEDWESTFSRRYPDLAGLEMVETELDGGGPGANARRSQREMRIRDVED